MEFLYYLEPVYDRRKSFYKKATVYRTTDGRILLVSYSTVVAEIKDAIMSEDGQPVVKVNGWYSCTTARHINDFLYQYGFKPMTKKQMEASNGD